MSAAQESTSALEQLPESLRRFVEGLASGMTGVEAAKYAGSEGTNRNSLAVTASRWKQQPEVRAALAEIREQFLVDDNGLLASTLQALRDLVRDKANPNARARACELVLKLSGKLAPEQHLHAHVHAAAPVADLEPQEEQRLLGIALRGSVLLCPCCGETFAGAAAVTTPAGAAS